MQNDREFLRHTLATLAYRGGKVVRDAPVNLAALKLHETTRTPLETLAHVNDLLDWALRMADGEYRWTASQPESWDAEVTRFFGMLAQLDLRLGNDARIGHPEQQIFQGPIADALTHVGQIALLRRIAGAPVRAENYFKADIVGGRVGREQTKPTVEWD